MSDNTVVLGVGDLILDVEGGCDRFFEPSLDYLRNADITFGNVEVPHSNRSYYTNVEAHVAPPADPKNLEALKYAGFDAVSWGSNHCYDQGHFGFMDTMNTVKDLGIEVFGAGKNIEEARKPVTLERNGIRFALFHYNLTGPSWAYASYVKSGAAYVRCITHYENDRAGYGESPSLIYTFADYKTKFDMEEDIENAKKTHDVVIVSFHGGRAGHPDVLPVERELARSAIDHGATAVVYTHSHAIAGFEIYHGKPVYYGLGNFVTLTPAMNMQAANAKQRRSNPYAWPGVVPYWDYDPFAKAHPKEIHYYPFADFSRNTMIAKLEFSKDGLVSAGFIPCYINSEAQPVPEKCGGKGYEVVDYIMNWENESGLNVSWHWNDEGTEVIFDLQK